MNGSSYSKNSQVAPEWGLFRELNALLLTERTGPSDAVVWLQGDRFDRAQVTLDLYRNGSAPVIIISGNDTLIGKDPRPGEENVSLGEMRAWLKERGVPDEAIIMERESMNTRDQSLHVCKMAKRRGWRALTMVGSYPHYQARYYLTFLQGKKETGWDGDIRSAAAVLGPDQIPGGRDKTAGELMEDEFRKILEYEKRGHCVPLEEGIREMRQHGRHDGI